MFSSLRIFILFILAVSYISGCASLPVTGRLPEGIAVKELVRTEEGIAAWHPSGDRFAFLAGSLHIYNLERGESVLAVPGAEGTALGWSPDGRYIAAAFTHGDGSMLRILDSGGKVVAEAKIGGRATNVMWRAPDDIVVSAVLLKNYSFGPNFSGVLYRWNGTAPPSAKVLADTTLKPATAAAWGEGLFRTFSVSLSPLGDELVYTKIVDPPQFPPYLKIMIHNLETGAEREAPAKIALNSGGAAFTADGERIVYGEGVGRTVEIDPWIGAVTAVYPTPGRSIALSPGNLHKLLDGTLFRGDLPIAAFPEGVRGTFSPNGTKFLLHFENRLYLLSGLNEPPAAVLSQSVKDRLLLFRKWRSEGLISASEYDAAKGRLNR